MRIALPPLVAALALAVTGSACVTRTVYVVDDDPRNDPPPRTARAAAPEATAMPYDDRYEDSAGITSEADFYEPLSPYGSWVAYPGYGRVFVPAVSVVGSGFRPYTYGHWEYSEWGWTWVDHHPFGWATGHYGRWFYDGSYGWVWVPGTSWAPAWVTWRSGGGYVGWAPLPPGAAFGSAYTVYDTSWVFVSTSSMGVAYIGSVIIVGSGYRTCYYETYPARDTVVVYGRTYYRGPDEDEVVRGGGHVIHRPAHEADHNHPVTRPPEGSARPRPSDGHTGGDGGRHDSGDTSGTSRPRDDGRPRPGGGYDGPGRDDGHGSSGHDDGRGSSVGRDDGRSVVDVPGGVDRGPARGQPQPDRGPRDGRPAGLDDLDPYAAGRAVDVQPREDPAASGTVNYGTPPARGRDGTASGVIDDGGPAPIRPRDDGAGGTFDGSRDPARPATPYNPYDPTRGTGTLAPRPVERVPDVDRRDDSRLPYNDVTRPRSDNPVDPDRVRGVTRQPLPSPAPSRPDRGGFAPNPGPAGPSTHAPSRGPSGPPPATVAQPDQPQPDSSGQPSSSSKKKATPKKGDDKKKK